MFELLLAANKEIILPDSIAGISTNTNALIPVATHALGHTMLGNKLYLYGGSQSSNLTNTFLAYDMYTKNYATLSGSPGLRSGPGLFAINGKIYMFAGATSATAMTNEYWQYDPSNNTWTKLTAISAGQGRYYHAVAVVNDIMYSFGGVGASNAQYTIIESFNPVTNGVANLGNIDKAKHGMSIAVWDNLIYTFGGINGATCSNDLYVFNPTNNSYTKITPTGTLPPARVYGAMEAYKGKLYLFGGLTTSSGAQVNDLWCYDIANNSWTQLTLTGSVPNPVGVVGHGIWQNQFHIVGGLEANTTRVRTHYYFT